MQKLAFGKRLLGELCLQAVIRYSGLKKCVSLSRPCVSCEASRSRSQGRSCRILSCCPRGKRSRRVGILYVVVGRSGRIRIVQVKGTGVIVERVESEVSRSRYGVRHLSYLHEPVGFTYHAHTEVLRLRRSRVVVCNVVSERQVSVRFGTVSGN